MGLLINTWGCWSTNAAVILTMAMLSHARAYRTNGRALHTPVVPPAASIITPCVYPNAPSSGKKKAHLMAGFETNRCSESLFSISKQHNLRAIFHLLASIAGIYNNF